MLFNHYQNNIIYKDNLCKLFIKSVSVDNVNFDYCGISDIVTPIICYFVYRCLNDVLSKDNVEGNSVFKNGKQKSRKLLKIKHI